MTVYAAVQLKVIERAAYDRDQAQFFDAFKKFNDGLLSADENPAILEGAWDCDKSGLTALTRTRPHHHGP